MDEKAAVFPLVPKAMRFYITFGQRYRSETHPAGEWITPDGYVIIVAGDEQDARNKANEVFGPEGWAFIYDHLDRETGRFNTDNHYPRGVLATYITDKGNLHG